MSLQDPMRRFTPPKPRMAFHTEFFSIDELWDKWAKKRIDAGVDIEAEEKLNGLRAIIQKKDDRITVKFEDAMSDRADAMPGLVEPLKKLPDDFVLDCSLGIERSGKPLPRIELMTLLSKRPQLESNDVIVASCFDVPYHQGSDGDHPGDLTDKPLRVRRQHLEYLIQKIGSRNYELTHWTLVDDKASLNRAFRKLSRMPMSEGIVIKESDSAYKFGGMDEWAKVKNVLEIKTIVLKKDINAAGSYNYHGGLSSPDGYENIVELTGSKYADLGKTFNSKINASVGDIITVQIHELIPSDDGKRVSWLGATVQDIDRARSTPYSVSQAVDLARRHRIWQGIKSLGFPMSEGYDRMALAMGQEFPDGAGIHEGKDRYIYRSSLIAGELKDRQLVILKNDLGLAYALTYDNAACAIIFFKDDGWTRSRVEAFLSDTIESPALAKKHWLDDEGDDKEKINPFHDVLGRFSEGPGAGSSKIISKTLTPEYQREIRSWARNTLDGIKARREELDAATREAFKKPTFDEAKTEYNKALAAISAKYPDLPKLEDVSSVNDALYILGSPNRARDETDAMAEYIEKKSGSRLSMLRALSSQTDWGTQWVEAKYEWLGAQSLGANSNSAKSTQAVLSGKGQGIAGGDLSPPKLSDSDEVAFKARTEFIQARFREKYADKIKGDNILVYRGISGKFAAGRKYMAEIEKAKSGNMVDMQLYGLSSWSLDGYSASDFAYGYGPRSKRHSGMVVSAEVPIRDIFGSNEIGARGIIRFTDDHDEVVIMTKNPSRFAKIES